MVLFFALSNTQAVFHVEINGNQWKNEEIIGKSSLRINCVEIDLVCINIWGWDG